MCRWSKRSRPGQCRHPRPSPAHSAHILVSLGKNGWLAMNALQALGGSRSDYSASQQRLPMLLIWPVRKTKRNGSDLSHLLPRTGVPLRVELHGRFASCIKLLFASRAHTDGTGPRHHEYAVSRVSLSFLPRFEDRNPGR